MSSLPIPWNHISHGEIHAALVGNYQEEKSLNFLLLLFCYNFCYKVKLETCNYEIYALNNWLVIQTVTLCSLNPTGSSYLPSHPIHNQMCDHLLLNNLHNIFVLKNMLFAALLRLMFHRGSPTHSTETHNSKGHSRYLHRNLRNSGKNPEQVFLRPKCLLIEAIIQPCTPIL